MTAKNKSKARLVVGLLSTAEEVTLALADLRARRLTPARMRVIGQADALDGALARRWTAGEDARGFAAWLVWRPAEGHLPWSLSHAGPAPDATAERDVAALLDLDHWALRRQAQKLDRHLRAGGVLLLIEACSDAEEWEACTALLRHASGGVQTHEIALPGGCTCGVS